MVQTFVDKSSEQGPKARVFVFSEIFVESSDSLNN